MLVFGRVQVQAGRTEDRGGGEPVVPRLLLS